MNCCMHLSRCVCYAFYLEGPQAELNKDPGLCSCVFWQEGKHHVVHPKQWDEKQSRFGQPPAHIARHTHEDFIQFNVFHVFHCVNGILFSLEMTGVVATDTWRSQLLHQDADHIDEDYEVHLRVHMRKKKIVIIYLQTVILLWWVGLCVSLIA